MELNKEFIRYRIHSVLERHFDQLTFSGGNNIIYWVIQIIMYGGAGLFFLAAILIPSNPLVFSQSFDESTQIKTSIVNREVVFVMYILKSLVFIAGLGFGVAGWLCSKIRKRNSILVDVEESLESLKKDLE